MNFQLNLKKVKGELRKLFLLEIQQTLSNFVPVLFFVAIFIPNISQASIGDDFSSILSKYSYNPAYQSACIKSNGIMFFAYRENTPMVPASVSKIYVTDWALSVRGPEFKYKTKFVLYGNTLSIIGNKDPQFVQEDLYRVFKNLSKKERLKITKISFDKNVIFNWKTNPVLIDKELEKVSKKYFGRKINSTYSATLPVASNMRARLTLTSPPLYRILKEMNQYSNNVTTDTIFTDLGGVVEFNKYMAKTYGTKGAQAVFLTGSGIYGNTTTCELTILVLVNIVKYLNTTPYTLTDILVVPTVDEGANKKRFTEDGIGSSLVLKTGNVYHTYSVAGVLNSSSPVYFVIFTFDPINPLPKGGDALVQEFVYKLGKQFPYLPFLYQNKDYNTLDERIIK